MQLFPIHHDGMRKWTRESSCKMTLPFRYDREFTDGGRSDITYVSNRMFDATFDQFLFPLQDAQAVRISGRYVANSQD